METNEPSNELIAARINTAFSLAADNRWRVHQVERAALGFINGVIPPRIGNHLLLSAPPNTPRPVELVYVDPAFRGDDSITGYDTEITRQIRDCYRKDVESYNVKVVVVTPPVLVGSQNDDLRALSKSTRVAEEMINNVLSASSNYAMIAYTMEAAIDFSVMVTTVDLLPYEGKLDSWEDPADYIKLTSYRTSNLIVDYNARTIDRMRYLGFLELVPISTIRVLYPKSSFAILNKEASIDAKAVLVRYIDLDLGVDIMGVSLASQTATVLGNVEILEKRKPQFKNARGNYILPIACLTYGASPVHPLMGKSPLMENAASLQDIAKVETDLHQALANYKDVTIVGSKTQNVHDGTISLGDSQSTTIAKNIIEDYNSAPNFGFITAQSDITFERISNNPAIIDLMKEHQLLTQALYGKLGFTWNEVGRTTNATATEVKELKRHRSGQTGLLHSCLDRYITQLANVVCAALRQLLHPDKFDAKTSVDDLWYTVKGKPQAYSPKIFAFPFDLSSFKEGASLEETVTRVDAMANLAQKLLSLQSAPVEGELAIGLRTQVIGKMVEELGLMSAVEYSEKSEAEQEQLKTQAALAQQSAPTLENEPIDPNVIPTVDPSTLPDPTVPL